MSDDLIDASQLRAAVTEVLDDLSTSADVRAAMIGHVDSDSALWKHAVDAGWTSLEVPEAYGGLGAPFSATALVLEEMGRHLSVSPLWSSLVLGIGGLLTAGTAAQQDQWLPSVAAGEVRATAVLGHDGTMPMSARRDGEAWIVEGRAEFVPDADDSVLTILAATSVDGPVLLLAEPGTPDLHVTPIPLQDVTRRVAQVTASGLRLPASAVMAVGKDALCAHTALFDRAALGIAADSLGVAIRALDTTVAHAKDRVQFGRQIGSFQAVKHRCTDMLIANETSRLSLTRGVTALSRNPHEASAAVSAAKVMVGESAFTVTDAALGLHGGIGFTWEHDCHLMLKRAMLSRQLFGSSRWHRRRLADLQF